MASAKGKGLAAVIRANPSFVDGSQATTESSYDGNTGGGVSLLDHPDPSSPPQQKMAPFEAYASKQRGEVSGARAANPGNQNNQAASASNKSASTTGGNASAENGKGQKQQGKSAMKGGANQVNGYRPTHATANVQKASRQSVSFASPNIGDKSGNAPSNASYNIFSPVQSNGVPSYTTHHAKGNLTGSASAGQHDLLAAQADGTGSSTPHARNAVLDYQTPSQFGVSQQSHTVPRSFAPHQGLVNHGTDSMPPPVFSIGTGVPSTPASQTLVSAQPGLAAATPHGSAIVSSAQMIQQQQFYGDNLYIAYNSPMNMAGPMPVHQSGLVAQSQQYSTAVIACANVQGTAAAVPSIGERSDDSYKQLVPGSQRAVTSPLVTWQPLQTARLRLLPTATTWLRNLTNTPTGKPDVVTGMQNFPFVHSYSNHCAPEFGVVKLTNIPYATTKAEILAMIGRNAKLPKDAYEPVHIIMEKVTAKTQDAYVEFLTVEDAERAVQRYADLVDHRRQPRLGQRPVELELSSQEALLKDLFPFAFGVAWNGATPVIQPEIKDSPWTKFKGFVTAEEIHNLLRAVEMPQRGPYSRDVPQRPYECMISTIKKFPWFCPEYVSVMQRHLIYSGTLKLATILRKTLNSPQHDKQDGKVNEQLMQRFFQAAMLCPGFSIVQKDNIAQACELKKSLKGFNIPAYADSWAHQHTLCPKPGVPVDVLEWYIALIREETTNFLTQNIHEKTLSEIPHKLEDTDDHGYFGFAWVELNLPDQKALAQWTLKDLGNLEMCVFRAIVERALRRAA